MQSVDDLIPEMECEQKLASVLMPDLVIEVASRSEAGDILSSPERCAEVTCLISIGAPNDELPIGYHNISSKLRLLFGDTLDAETGATEADVYWKRWIEIFAPSTDREVVQRNVR